jgi:oligopeptide transport system ATP-binding protein
MNKEEKQPEPAEAGPPSALLEIEDLVTVFHTDDGVVRAVDGISYRLERGKTLGVVGESGSGKSVTNLSIMRLLPMPPAEIQRGKILFDGQDLLQLDEKAMRKIRGREISMIFQDPMTSLNPFLRISLQLTEVLEHHMGMKRSEARVRAIEMLARVGLPDPERRIDSYPHELSGGMRQRVMIAMALLCGPKLLIADEPTTALDVTIQAQILDLMKELVAEGDAETRTALILVTHDLGVVAGIADHVLVMYAGKMMEYADTVGLFHEPRHPYTLGLLRSIPGFEDTPREKLPSISGLPPDPANLPPGCPFAPRCPFRSEICEEVFPEPRETAPGHWIRCHADVGRDDISAFLTEEIAVSDQELQP